MELGTSDADAAAKQEQARKRARESSTGLMVFMMLGRYMVELAAKNEPDPNVRRFKRSQLLDEWSAYTTHVAAKAV